MSEETTTVEEAKQWVLESITEDGIWSDDLVVEITEPVEESVSE